MQILLMWLSVILGLSLFSGFAQNGQFTLVPVWQSEPVFKIPESIIYDLKTKLLFVSNIDGKPTDKDGRGFISKVALDGKIVNLEWITGLNAPKGSAIFRGQLFVSDIDHLVEISIGSSKIIKRHPASDAVFLNDVAADEAGNIYVSDMAEENSAIYRLSKNKLEKWLVDKEISSPNGLYYEKGFLYFGNSGDGKIKKVELASKKISTVANIGSGIDGLVADGQGNFLISDWSGKTSIVERDGIADLLLDTAPQKINSADLEFVKEQQLLIIPTFFDNRLIAYRLEKK